MKVLFDTNVYVAEALLGQAAEEMVSATEQASWRIYASLHILDEFERVMVEEFRMSRRLAILSRRRIVRRSTVVEPSASRHHVPADIHDTPILRAALAAGVDYLVTKDRHLLALDPYEGIRIVLMTQYREILVHEGIIRT